MVAVMQFVGAMFSVVAVVMLVLCVVNIVKGRFGAAIFLGAAALLLGGGGGALVVAA